jgi:hypothetical protein
MIVNYHQRTDQGRSCFDMLDTRRLGNSGCFGRSHDPSRRVNGWSPTDGPLQLTASNLAAVRRTLEAAGIEFIFENGGGQGVRLRKEQ